MANDPTAQVHLSVEAIAAPVWRFRLIHALQIFAALVMGVGLMGTQWLNVISIFDPEISKRLAALGPVIWMAAKPTILLLGDVLDNGKVDGSFKLEANGDDPNQTKLPFVLLLIMCCLSALLTGCGAITYQGKSGSAFSYVPDKDISNEAFHTIARSIPRVTYSSK